jgi:hypothetical protein
MPSSAALSFPIVIPSPRTGSLQQSQSRLLNHWHHGKAIPPAPRTSPTAYGLPRTRRRASLSSQETCSALVPKARDTQNFFYSLPANDLPLPPHDENPEFSQKTRSFALIVEGPFFSPPLFDNSTRVNVTWVAAPKPTALAMARLNDSRLHTTVDSLFAAKRTPNALKPTPK